MKNDSEDETKIVCNPCYFMLVKYVSFSFVQYSNSIIQSDNSQKQHYLLRTYKGLLSEVLGFILHLI